MACNFQNMSPKSCHVFQACINVRRLKEINILARLVAKYKY